MEARCKNCRHWDSKGAEDQYGFQREDYGLKIPQRVGYCSKITANDGCDGLADDGAMITYPVAEVITGPNFGCIHFELTMPPCCVCGKPSTNIVRQLVVDAEAEYESYNSGKIPQKCQKPVGKPSFYCAEHAKS